MRENETAVSLSLRAASSLALMLVPIAAPGQAATRQAETSQLRIVRASDGWRLRIIAPGRTLELAGIEYSQTGSRGELQPRTLRFERAERLNPSGSWRLVSVGEPRARLDVSEALEPWQGQGASGDAGLVSRVDGYQLQLEIELGIPRRVRHVALRWNVLGAANRLTQRILPFRCRDELDVAPEACFATPICVAGDPDTGWISLRPSGARGPARLPSFVTFESRRSKQPEALIHGLGQASRRGARAFGLRSSGERQRGVLRLEHRIAIHSAQPIDRVIGQLAQSSWQRLHVAERARPITMRQQTVRALERAAALLRPIGGGQSVLAASAAELAGGVWNLEESPDSRPLATALAIHRLAQERDDEELVERARGVLRLFLSAPGRSGLFATRVQVDLRPRDKSAARVRWQLDDRGAYSTQDCARCATWWLRWAAVDPELRPECLRRARELGEFLLRNQHADGTWPARFKSDVVPIRDRLYSESIESAAIARFLLALDKSIRDDRWLAAAARTIAGLDRRITDARFFWRRSLGSDYEKTQSASLALPSRGLIDASLLCMEHPRANIALGQRFLALLLPMQRPVRGERGEAGAGGILRSNEEALHSDIACSEAASAFAMSWSKTGEPQMLARAAAALRAPFGLVTPSGAEGVSRTPRTTEPGTGAGDSSLAPLARSDSSLSGLATIAVWVDDFLVEYGDALVDFDSGTAIGFAHVEVELLSAADDPSIRLEVAGPSRPARVRLVGGERKDRRLICNGELFGPFSPAERDRGLGLVARPRIDLVFAPPRLHRRPRDLEFRVGLSARVADARVRVELAAGHARRPIESVELAASEDDAQRFAAVLQHSRFPAEAQLWARASMLHPRRVVGRWQLIELGDWGIADAGDDDERWLAYSRDARTARVGAGEGAQRIAKGGTVVYEVPIDANALRVELRVRVADHNAELVLTDQSKRVLEARRDDVVSAHRVLLRNRQLWRDGLLRLRVQARGEGSTAISELRFREIGSASSAAQVGEVLESPKLRRLDILALPCTTATASRFEREALRLALFADGDYRSTPGAREVATDGSLGSWLRALSRETLDVSGHVAPWRALDLHELASPRELIARIAAAHKGSLERPERSKPEPTNTARVVLVLHTGLSKAVQAIAMRASAFVDARPIVFVNVVDRRGRLLPLGTIAEAVLRAVDPELPPATSLSGGAFASLVLGSASAGPLPRLPLGLRLARLGWVPTYRATLSRKTGLRVPTIDEGFVLELPCTGLPGRGRVLIERRPHSDLAEWRDGGLLGYWDFGRARGAAREGALATRLMPSIVLRSVESRRALRPRILPTHEWPRLVTQESVTTLPLQTGELVTPHGERAWQLRVPPAGLGPNEGPGLTIDCLGKPLLEGSVTFAARHPTSQTFVPIAAGASSSETGIVHERSRTRLGKVSLRLPRGIGSRARLDFGATDLSTGARLCGRVRGAGLRLDCIVVSGGHERRVVVARLDAKTRDFVFTLPALGAEGTTQLRLEAIALVEDPQQLEVEALVLWPTTRALLDVFEFSPRAVVREALRLGDGSLRGPYVRLDAGKSLELPVSLRLGARLRLEASIDPQARQALRMTASFRPARSSEAIRLVPSVEVLAREHCQLQVVDLAELSTQTGQLVIERDAHGPPLYLTLASLRVR